jgi:mannose/cellobiose epimerase-like protein (N-acyl-D-glucosamine 2-epimerase family)
MIIYILSGGKIMETLNPKYRIDTPENKAFQEETRNTLLSFGHRFPSPAGSSYYLGDDGTPWTDRNRETWITSRMAHVYSLGTLLGHEGSEALTDAALTGLLGELHDTEHGGWYAGLTATGEIVPTKQCYAHAFVILAATSGITAGRPLAHDLLDQALELYDLRFWNEEEGLACDTWNTEFTVLDDYRGLNANMHTVEAFLAAADVTGDEKYRVRAGRIIDHVLGWAKENDWRIPEHFTKEWVADLECNKEQPDDPFKPYGATPGHGIEWARLITQWALSTYQADMAGASAYIQAAENLFNRAVTDAWNADGAPGIVYTTDWEGNPVVHDRMHWTLAEAINTSAVLYRVTNKPEYADRYAEFMQYLDEKVLDHVNGSWFHQLDRNNQLIGTVWPGKSDIYHALQSTLIPYYSPAVSIAPAVKKHAV